MTESTSIKEGTLQEHAIRPPDLMARQRVALLTDIGRLLSRRAEFVHVNCPACESAAARPLYDKFGFSYVECEACRTMYTNPRPPAEVLGWFYQGSENYAYWNQYIFPASEAVRRERIMVPRVDQVLALCEKFGIAPQSLLEVGAGFGSFCEELKSRNVFERVAAIEPTPNLAATCRAKGIETIELPIEQVEFSAADRFDVVVSFEVVEHLFCPRDFVAHIGRVLRPGGLLILSCPNGQGFDVQTLKAVSDTVDHEHLNYFNPASLSGLLERTGYEVIDSFTPGKMDADLVRNKALAGQFDLAQQPFLQTVLIDEWERYGGAFQAFLREQGLSSNMWVMARRAA
jgi:2-polyprenyl-3-methyl-5-hydroxy-6-metoxy-1,4-benzoquinol methylase